MLQTSWEMDVLDTADVKERSGGGGGDVLDTADVKERSGGPPPAAAQQRPGRWIEGNARQGSTDAICCQQFPVGLM